MDIPTRRRFATIIVFTVGIFVALWWRSVITTSSTLLDGNLANVVEESVDSQRHGRLAVPPISIGASGIVRREVVLMGTAFVFVVDAEPREATRAIEATTKRLHDLEREISSWLPDSDVAKLNARAGIEPVAVGEHTLELLRISKQLHRETDGTFDVTIGSVWDLWPFRDSGLPLPSQEQLAEGLKLVNASRIELDLASRTAYLPVVGMKVNLGAIGKGYAAKIAVDVMSEQGIERAAISTGGDIYLLGRKTMGPWIVGIEHPRKTNRYIEQFVAGDVAVATSGDAKRFIVRSGKRYGHILDPRTGMPATDCQSVTIAASEPAVADAYATAVFVMGPEAGMNWVEAHEGIESLIINAKGDITRSSGWSTIAGSIPGVSTAARWPEKAGEGDDRSSMASLQRSTPTSKQEEIPSQPIDSESGELVGVEAGTFLSGDDQAKQDVAFFRMDRTEVTNKQYQRFMEATRDDPHRFCHPDEPADKDHTPRYAKEFRSPLFRATPAARLAPFTEQTFRQGDHPVVGVDWWDAYAFARWAGKRLPSRLEWEKAARGTDGRTWPWGNDWSRKMSNGGGEKWEERDGHTYSAPASSFQHGASVYGCVNMAGNVAEWTQEGLVMGGGSNSNPSQVRCCVGELREPGYRSFQTGFRCATSAPAASSPTSGDSQ
jgi:thiamine biosynthesis lipoprotein